MKGRWQLRISEPILISLTHSCWDLKKSLATDTEIAWCLYANNVFQPLILWYVQNKFKTDGWGTCCKNPVMILSVHRRINISDLGWVSNFHERITQALSDKIIKNWIAFKLKINSCQGQHQDSEKTSHIMWENIYKQCIWQKNQIQDVLIPFTIQQ